MNLYEIVYLARSDISQQQADALTEQFKALIEENGGSVGKTENWGLRNTAYRIRKSRKAHYLLMNITCPPAALHEMERQMRLHEDVVRYLSIRVEEHNDAPSAPLQKRDKDDRGDRGGRGRR